MPVDWTGAAARSTVRAWRPKKGTVDRSEPDGSRQTGLEAPSCGRQKGDAARRDAVGRQPARQHDAQCHAGRRSGRSAWPRPAPTPSTEAPRRQGLRSQALPSGMPRPLRHTPHRSPWHRNEPKARPPPLGRRAHLRMARPAPPLGHPLRASRRHPPRFPQARMRPRLPQPNQQILLGALSACPGVPPGRRAVPVLADPPARTSQAGS